MGEIVMEQTATALDAVANPEMLALLDQLQRSAPALTRILHRLEEFQASGALDTMIDLADVVQAARVSMTDSMIARIGDAARVGMELMDVVMISGIPELAPALLNATAEARDAAAADTSTVGMWQLLKAFKEPEMQFALKFVLALARRLPAAARE